MRCSLFFLNCFLNSSDSSPDSLIIIIISLFSSSINLLPSRESRQEEKKHIEQDDQRRTQKTRKKDREKLREMGEESFEWIISITVSLIIIVIFSFKSSFSFPASGSRRRWWRKRAGLCNSTSMERLSILTEDTEGIFVRRKLRFAAASSPLISLSFKDDERDSKRRVLLQQCSFPLEKFLQNAGHIFLTQYCCCRRGLGLDLEVAMQIHVG